MAQRIVAIAMHSYLDLHPYWKRMHLIALLTQYSLKSGGFRVRELMGAGSLSYPLELAQFDVTVGSQLQGNDVALTFVRDIRSR